jgi:hypothetical protein
MVAAVIGPEGGSLSCKAGASVVFPAGALSEKSTVTIQPIANTKLPIQDGVDLLPNSAFDITIAGADGRAVGSLSAPAEFTLNLGKDRLLPGTKLYQVQGSSLVEVPNVKTQGNKLIVTLDSFSRIVAGVPAPTTAKSGRSVLPFILAAVVVVLAMIVMVVLGGIFRPRRQRVVVTRRPPRSRYR